jgi:hypothetical protein
MKNTTRHSNRESHCFSGVLCFALLTVLALFAACERPEPEPEPPTPQSAGTNTLPTNKFVGTWVLCGVSSVDENPPCACTDSLTYVDTLVFMANKCMEYHHGLSTWTFIYDYTPSFLLYYFDDPLDTICNCPSRVIYNFRNSGTELMINGYITNLTLSGDHNKCCFVKID